MPDHSYWVYILTNKHRTTLYIGMTNNLQRRIWQHRWGETLGFTKRYHLNRLIWFEHFREVRDAIACEKRPKGSRRDRKIALIQQTNPGWRDLSATWDQEPISIDPRLETEEAIRDSSLRSE